jgi:hypothetical protein
MLGHEAGVHFVYLCESCRIELVETGADKGFQVRDRFFEKQRMAAVTHKSECEKAIEGLDRWKWYQDRRGK